MTLETIKLVPYPQQMRRDQGEYRLKKDAVAVVRNDLSSMAVHHKLQRLKLAIDRGNVLPLSVRIGKPNEERLRPPRQPEGYALRCDQKGIIIRGTDSEGLFWGLATLEQLMDRKRRVPCVEIHDWPAFAFRGHHDDISRKQISTLEDFQRIIRLLSQFKIKYYTPYIEDVLFLPSFPKIGKGRGRLRPNEVRAMAEEAKRHNMTIFPTYSLLGHQENMLRNKDYRRLYGKEVFQAPSSYDPQKKELRPFLSQVIREVCEIFAEAPFFHGCFDETQGVEKEDFIAHANWCAEEIGKHGKRMLMWTDMFRHHFGVEAIHELSDNIIPVEWGYSNPGQFEEYYKEINVSPMGLAGYNNWCRFMPDSRAGKRNIEEWAEVMRHLNGPGFAAAQWGDNGYENHRDLMWNLFAYNGEVAWRGEAGPEDFEDRFQHVFYGKSLPALTRVIEEYPDTRPFDGRKIWELFRVNIQGMTRRIANDQELGRAAQQGIAAAQKAQRSLKTARSSALREREQLDHFDVALVRERNMCERLEMASRIEKGLANSKLETAVKKALENLEKARTLYRDDWLRTNRRPNIEISLRVYDDIARSLRALLIEEPQCPKHFLPQDLGTRWNRFFESVAGIPFGLSMVGKVPFQFAPKTKTHCGLEQGESLILKTDPKKIKDIHIIYGANGFRNEDRGETVLVLAESNGKSVFRDGLRNVEDICDWWAPLGEHIWAGGGFRYVNQKRNSLALTPGPCFGLMHLKGFQLPEDEEIDTIEIRCIGKGELAVFAVTLETDQ